MSADMMIICKEDNSSYQGDATDKAFQIDETSMGEPWTEFGKWFGERFCRAPGILEQLAGIKDHDFIILTKEDIQAIKSAFERLEHRDIKQDEFFKFLDEHEGKAISTENW